MLNNGTFLLLAYRISKLDKYNWKIFSRPGYRLFTINASVGLDSDDRESNMNEIYQIQRILQSIIPITSRINGSLNIQNLKKIGNEARICLLILLGTQQYKKIAVFN